MRRNGFIVAGIADSEGRGMRDGTIAGRGAARRAGAAWLAAFALLATPFMATAFPALRGSPTFPASHGPSAAGLAAQEPADTTGVPPDSVRYTLQGLRVEASRPTITAGGASGVELRLDSVHTIPSPTLAEALRAMPLIRVRQNSRGQVQPSLRGMEEREIAVLVDGVPITIGWDNRTDLAVLPLTAANEIRMVRGLSSVLAGPNALGGVVEVRITSGAFPEDRLGPGRLRAGLDQTGGLALSGELQHLWRDDSGGGVWLRYGGGWRESDGAPLADGLPAVARGEDGHLLNSDFEQGNGFLALRWQAKERGAWLSLSSAGFRAERGVVPELHILGGPDPEPRFWRIPGHWRSVTALSGGTGWGETPFGRGDLEASVGVDFQHLEIDAFDSITYADSVDGETGDDRTLSVRLLGDHTLGAGILRAAATLADTWHEEVLGGEPPREYEQLLWSLGVETEQPLPFAKDPDGLVSDPSLTVGLSADGSSTPRTGGAPSQPAIWGWGARIASRAAVGERAVVHGGVSRKVRFPALREMFSGALGKFEPNPDLGPVTLKVGELGATLQVGRGLELQATAFQQRLEGSIVRAVLESGQFQRQNRGETRATGLELLANLRAGGFALRGDFTLQDVSLRDDEGEPTDERPEYQPEVVAGLHLAQALPAGFRAYGDLEVLGSQFGANPETGEFEKVEPTAYLELGTGLRLPSGPGGLPPLAFSAAVENVTDEAIFDQLGLPRPGRTFRVQVEVF